MPLDKLNAALIAAIQNGTPEYTNPAAILTDKLNIGREAAYRRLRGEVPFTFGEAAVLSAQMNFSLDRAVGAVDFGNVLFRLSFNDYHTALEDYTGVIDQDTLFYREVSSDADAEQAIAGNSFPRMLYMRYEGLTNFKLFKWLYQQGLVDCSTTKFEDMKVPDALLRSYRDLLKDMDIEATYCYVAARHYRASCIETFSINSLRSADPGMFEHVKRWITSLSRFATLISCSGELQRIHFFKRQRAIVAELEREGLEPSPSEVFQE